MNFDELKKRVSDFLKNNTEYTERAVEELKRIKVCLDEGFDWFEYFENLENYSDAYVIPFVLGKTTKINLDKPMEFRRIRGGDTGGLDIDTDVSTEGKPRLKKYLIEKYGTDRVVGVGTYGTLGLASSIKDILRKENVPFKESNDFCKELDNEKTFLENMENYKNNFPLLYGVYLKNKVKLDLVDKMSNVIRSTGQHAGGIIICEDEIYKHTPVQNVKGDIATSFVENGGNTELDEMGVIKFDLLGITTLDIIDDAISKITEKLYKIVDDDGIEKIVPESYIKNFSD